MGGGDGSGDGGGGSGGGGGGGGGFGKVLNVLWGGETKIEHVQTMGKGVQILVIL